MIAVEPLDLPGPGRLDLPDAGQIGFPVRHPWRRREQVRLAIPGPRDSRFRLVEPLRLCSGQRARQEDSDRDKLPRHGVGKSSSSFVNLMDALKKSLDAVSTTKKKPAKAQATAPAAKRKRA
jgi:hypothetical protein